MECSSQQQSLYPDSVVGNRKEQELLHGSLPCAILRVETRVINEDSGSQRAAESLIREDVSMFRRENMPFLQRRDGLLIDSCLGMVSFIRVQCQQCGSCCHVKPKLVNMPFKEPYFNIVEY